MNEWLYKIKMIFMDPVLKKRVFFTIGALVVFRIFAAIPVPGVDLAQLGNFFSNNQLLGFLNIFSGGGLSNLSIVMLGVGPYITASIIMQLLTMIFPKLKELYHEEGEAGRHRFARYSRFLTLPIALIQGYGLLILLSRSNLIDSTGFDMFVNVIIVTAGSILLMWLGELITEKGIGNGTSLIIFAGIVAAIPTSLVQLWYARDISQIPLYLAVLIISAIVIFTVVIITEAERPIPVTYAKRVRGMKVYGGVSTYLPLRLNQAGVIPIIFALSILVFPQMVINAFGRSASPAVQKVADVLLSVINNPWIYAVGYFVLVFLFTYFYTAVTFEPHTVSTNLQKSGAFIPGVRPGQSTADHIAKILTRITLVGALFLGFIAVLPLVIQSLTGVAALAIGGTALLIVVSVVLDLVKKIDAQVSMREY